MVHEIYGSRQMLPGHRNRNNPPSTQPTVMVPASKMGFKKKTVCLLCLKCFFHRNENFDGLLFFNGLKCMPFSNVTTKIGSHQNSQMPNKRGYDMAWWEFSTKGHTLCWQEAGTQSGKWLVFGHSMELEWHSMDHPHSQQNLMMRSNGMQCTPGLVGGVDL